MRANAMDRADDLSGWARRGTASAVRDCELGPDGLTPATLITVGAFGVDDLFRALSALPASSSLPTTLWIKKASAAGTLGIRNPSGSESYGFYQVDLAALPGGWVRIGDDPLPGVTVTSPFRATSAGGGGVIFFALSGGPLSVHVARVQQEAGVSATSFSTLLVEGPDVGLTNPDDPTAAGWVRRGALAAERDGTLAPDGVAQAVLLTGLGPPGVDDVFQVKSDLPAGTFLKSTFWIKKVSTAGVVRVTNASGNGGQYDIDLSTLPSGWIRIGVGPVAGLAGGGWSTTASGGAGVQLAAVSGAPLSVYVAGFRQQLYPTVTRAAETLTVANPLTAKDAAWCIDAGLWTLAAGPNSASLVMSGSNLVFTVTDAAGEAKSVTATGSYLYPGAHRIAACNNAGELALYVDGRQMGSTSGAGSALLTQMPATLTVTEAIGALPAIRIARSGNPASLNQPASPSLIVALTFDDGNLNQYQYAVPILESHGMRGTFYVVADTLGQPGRMTKAQLRAIAASGHEIASHTLSHADLRRTVWPLDKLKREICDSRAWLIEEGFEVRSLAYPWGFSDATTREFVMSCGYDSARVVGGLNGAADYCGEGAVGSAQPFFDSIPPLSGWSQLRSAGAAITNTCTVDSLRNLVLDAERHLPAANGPAVLPLMFHHVCPGKSCSPSLAIDPVDLSAFLDWLQPRSANGTVVMTIGQAMGMAMRPGVWSGTPPVINGGFEDYVNAGAAGAPDCWRREATGGATAATWSRIAGRSGSYAQQAVVTTWSSGGTVRLSQDAAHGRSCTVPTRPMQEHEFTCWYKSDVPVRMDARSMDGSTSSFGPAFSQSSAFPPSPLTWAKASWTATAPDGAVALSFGLGVYDGICSSGCVGAPGTATIQVDDCSAVELSGALR